MIPSLVTQVTVYTETCRTDDAICCCLQSIVVAVVTLELVVTVVTVVTVDTVMTDYGCPSKDRAGPLKTSIYLFAWVKNKRQLGWKHEKYR